MTQSRLVRDLRSLGVERGQVVMCHEAVSQIGWVVGGPDVVLDALLEVLGPEGTLMKYVGSEDGTYAVDEWPPEVRQAYLDECPGFDPERTRACREWGILTEYLRTRPGAKRSGHPDGSFAALGALASHLTENHPLQNGLGPGSPLHKLIEKKGKVLLLGSPLAHVTLLHYAEYLADVPNKKKARYRMPLARGGKREWVEIEELDSSTGIVNWPHSEDGDYFEPIVREFLEAGHGRSGKVGFADSHLIDAAALNDFGQQWMERHLPPYAR